MASKKKDPLQYTDRTICFGYPDDTTKDNPKSQIRVSKVEITYVQRADNETFSEETPSQELTVVTGDDGWGPWYNIKTDRWSINDPEELVLLLKDARARTEMITKNGKITKETIEI